jgi:hypothetical protein
MSLSYLRANGYKQAVTYIQELRPFELMYTLQGKPDQHATRFPRSVRVWSPTICISHGQRIATFCVAVNRVEQGHIFREKGLPTQFT